MVRSELAKSVRRDHAQVKLCLSPQGLYLEVISYTHGRWLLLGAGMLCVVYVLTQ